MDNKEIFEKREKRYEELKSEKLELIAKMEEFKASPEYADYHSRGEIDKEDGYPEQYKIEKSLEEVDKKIEAYKISVVKSASDMIKEYEKDIATLEEQLAYNKSKLDGLDKTIEELNEKIDEIADSEEYKKGDYKAVSEYQDLMSKLTSATMDKNRYESDKTNIEAELDEVKVKREKLLDKYKEDIDAMGKETPDEKSQDEKDGKSKGKKERTSKGGVVLPDANDNPEELTPEEKAEKEKAEKVKKLKEDFTDLSSKAKKGTLTDKELDSFIVILKDKDNYEKLGLSMGLIFNKPRGIFKALNKKYKDDEAKLASINEAYSVYEEKFFEKHGKDKLDKLSKFFIIDEVEHKEATKALPEKVVVESQKKSLGEELGDKTVADNEYVDISSSSKTKEEPAKEVI